MAAEAHCWDRAAEQSQGVLRRILCLLTVWHVCRQEMCVDDPS